MKKTFEYFYVTSAMDELPVDDIGNCIIECNDDSGYFYYLLITTALGVSRVIFHGPFIDGGFPTHCSTTFDQFDYNERKLIKKIEKFLSTPGITQARIVDDIDEISDRIVNLMEYYTW